jgi:hypothetical protein
MQAGGILLSGSPVKDNVGRLGYVLKQKFCVSGGRMTLAGYVVQLVEGRGCVFKTPAQLTETSITRVLPAPSCVS